MTKPIRRVVTGHNTAGKSIFVMDSAAPHVYCRVPGSVAVTELWETFRLPPPKNGSVFRIIEYPPDSVRLAAIKKEEAMGDDGSGRHQAADRNNPRHAGMHKTDTVDYAIVLAGEIYALMDEGEVLLEAGDVLVQRGTNHAWSNRSEASAYLAFVLVDAEPLT